MLPADDRRAHVHRDTCRSSTPARHCPRVAFANDPDRGRAALEPGVDDHVLDHDRRDRVLVVARLEGNAPQQLPVRDVDADDRVLALRDRSVACRDVRRRLARHTPGHRRSTASAACRSRHRTRSVRLIVGAKMHDDRESSTIGDMAVPNSGGAGGASVRHSTLARSPGRGPRECR